MSASELAIEIEVLPKCGKSADGPCIWRRPPRSLVQTSIARGSGIHAGLWAYMPDQRHQPPTGRHRGRVVFSLSFSSPLPLLLPDWRLALQMALFSWTAIRANRAIAGDQPRYCLRRRPDIGIWPISPLRLSRPEPPPRLAACARAALSYGRDGRGSRLPLR